MDPFQPPFRNVPHSNIIIQYLNSRYSKDYNNNYNTKNNENIIYDNKVKVNRYNIISCYKKLRAIGEGMYGSVYLAQNIKNNEIFAIKRISLKVDNQDGVQISIIREINILYLLRNCKNIINLKEIINGEYDDEIYLVMEYCPFDLDIFIRKYYKIIKLSHIKSIIYQLLSAVNYIHDNWIIHRDIKPSNILITSDGILKLADFGLVRKYESPIRPYTDIVVTLWYRAPELLLGCELYDMMIDIWSVGCVMGELLLQRPLFPGNCELATIDRIFTLLGTPDNRIWNGFDQLPHVKKFNFIQLEGELSLDSFKHYNLSYCGYSLLKGLLCYDPCLRLSAKQALESNWFTEEPLPELIKISDIDNNFDYL